MMKFNSQVSGMQKLQNELKKLAGSFDGGDRFALIGFPDAGTRPDGESNAHIAAQHEFGMNGMPERPFLRNGVQAAVPQIKDAMSEGMAKIAEGKLDPSELLNMVGATAAASVQQMIDEIKSPANSAATVAKKGSSNPLIDTGEMRQSVTWVLTSETPTEGI